MILYWMRSTILSQCRDLSSGLCAVLGFQLLSEQESFAVAGNEIFFCGIFR